MCCGLPMSSDHFLVGDLAALIDYCSTSTPLNHQILQIILTALSHPKKIPLNLVDLIPIRRRGWMPWRSWQGLSGRLSPGSNHFKSMSVELANIVQNMVWFIVLLHIWLV